MRVKSGVLLSREEWFTQSLDLPVCFSSASLSLSALLCAICSGETELAEFNVDGNSGFKVVTGYDIETITADYVFPFVLLTSPFFLYKSFFHSSHIGHNSHGCISAAARRSILDPVLTSNLFYFLTGMAALNKQYVFRSLPYFLLAYFSSCYHISYEQDRICLSRDKSCAIVTVFSNSFRLIELFRSGYYERAILATIMAFVSLFIYYKQRNTYNVTSEYTFYHTLWHIVSGVGSLILFVEL